MSMVGRGSDAEVEAAEGAEGAEALSEPCSMQSMLAAIVFPMDVSRLLDQAAKVVNLSRAAVTQECHKEEPQNQEEGIGHLWGRLNRERERDCHFLQAGQSALLFLAQRACIPCKE